MAAALAQWHEPRREVQKDLALTAHVNTGLPCSGNVSPTSDYQAGQPATGESASIDVDAIAQILRHRADRVTMHHNLARQR